MCLILKSSHSSNFRSVGITGPHPAPIPCERKLLWLQFACFRALAERIGTRNCREGVGVAKGTIGGRLLADKLAFPKPRKNPPRPFLDLAAMFMVNWEQRKAGR
jgi:hypothetical protein